MFWNLVRYEFKNVNKWFLALYAAVLSLSVIIGIQGSSLSSTYYQDKGESSVRPTMMTLSGMKRQVDCGNIFITNL